MDGSLPSCFINAGTVLGVLFTTMALAHLLKTFESLPRTAGYSNRAAPAGAGECQSIFLHCVFVGNAPLYLAGRVPDAISSQIR